MSDKTHIEWTDATWNPTRGCTRVSAGCQHCYAETVAKRFSKPGQPYAGLIHPKTGGWNGKVRVLPEALQIPYRWVKGRRIFVDSMSDLFHEAVPFEFIAAVFWVMSHTTRHTYQVLTKRPERMLAFFQWIRDRIDGEVDAWDHGDVIFDAAHTFPEIHALDWEPATATRGGYDNCGPSWPCANVWLGVSVENQETADERIPLLLECPAAVLWVSAEPLLGGINLRPYLGAECTHEDATVEWDTNAVNCRRCDEGSYLDWVVAGGESGQGARPMHPDWARSLRDQCAAAGVPFLFKQWGAWAPYELRAGGDLGGELRRGTVQHLHAPGNPEGHFRRGDEYVQLVGKKASGRLLDGVQHDGYPA